MQPIYESIEQLAAG